MDRRKGWKSDADSVIAGLMGLEQLRPRQPFHGNRRALSDSYMSKSSSVGLRVGSLVSIQPSLRMKNESEHSVKNVLGTVVLKCGDGFDLDNSKSLTFSKGIKMANPSGRLRSNSSSRATYQDKRSLDKSGEGCVQGNVLNCEQKPEHDLGELHMNCVKAFDLQSDVVIKRGFVEPKSEKVTNGFKDGKAGIHSKSACAGQDDYLGPKSGNCYPKSLPNKKLVNEIVSLRQKCIGCTRNMNSVSQQVPDRQKFSEISMRGYLCDHYLVNGQDMKNAYVKHPSPYQLPSSNGSRKQNFGKWARLTGVSRIEFSGSDQLHTDVIALEGRKSAVVKIEALSNVCNSRQGDSMPKENRLKQQTISQIDTSKSKAGKDSDQLQATCGVHDMQPSPKDLDNAQSVQDEMGNGSEHDRLEMELSKKILKSLDSNLTAQNMNNTTHASPEGFSVEVCSRINSEALSAINPIILSVEGGHTSDIHYDFGGEASITEFSEESAYSSSSRIGTPDFQENPKRAYQHSPDSVLERFEGRYSLSDRCIDCTGPQFQLDILNLEAEYVYSEGSVMGVSADDDSEEQFAYLSHNGKKIKSWLGHDESRNFSYMVDVLDEAGFCGIKSCMDLKTWHSPESPINPLVFEALGKKYGKQTSWPQSERRLLFDSINSGLLCILNPVLNFNTSLKGFLYANLRRDEVEDALWQMLIHQKEEKNKCSSNKDPEKWLEAEEGMNIICIELETSLLDELVGELVTAWING